jgi:NADH-quinone oxidoreductase subunit G
VSGLGNARIILEKIKSGEARYDLVEVMACPGGCIGGAGQPVSNDPAVRQKRTKGIYENDRMLELHKSQQNPYVMELYSDFLGQVGGHKAHELLHTGYKSRKRISDSGLSLTGAGSDSSLEVSVCFGTSCFLRGSQKLFHDILEHIRTHNLSDAVNVSASFCFEKCDRGPTVRIGETVLEKCTIDMAIEAIGRNTYKNPRYLQTAGEAEATRI